MCRIITVCLAIITGIFSASGLAAEQFPTLESAPDKNSLQERIQQAKKHVSVYERGHVIVGQVVVEEGHDPTLVHSQMLILDGGYFAGPTRDLTRPVGFRMHGYAPYDLELKGKKGDVVDVGIIKMRRLRPPDLVPIKGKLVLEGTSDPRQVAVAMYVTGGPVNTPSSGTEPRPKWAEPMNLSVDSSGLFQGDGFSPVAYYCSITAPGFVSKGFTVELKPRVGADLGAITLEKPRRIVLDYIVSKGGPFEIKDVKKAVLTGGDRWKATADIYGWDLEFTQKEGKLYFNYSYAPCSIADLGTTELKEFLNVDEASAKDSPRDMPVKDGHLYLLNQGHWKRTVLFKLTIQQPK